jgi:4-azaleucine resistance transporter AzlC
LPILAGYLFLGFAYGILMYDKGFSIIWTILMASCVFAGAMQFAAIPLLLSTFNPLLAFMMTLLVNVRHIFYGLSMLDKYKDAGWKKIFMIFMMADEAFSVSVAATIDDKVNKQWFYFFVSLICYLYWQAACIGGHLFAIFIPTKLIGLDFTLTALFYVMILNQWDKVANRKYVFLGFTLTLLALILVGKTQFLLVAMILMLLALVPKWEKRHD